MRLLILFLCLGATLLSQSFKPTYQSNPNLNLDTVLAGVRYIYLMHTEKFQKSIDFGEEKDYQKAVRGFLKSLGFETIGLTSNQKEDINSSAKSLCDIVSLDIYYSFPKESQVTLTLYFHTCTDAYFKFESVFTEGQLSYWFTPQMFEFFLKKWKQMYQRNRIFYDVKYRLSLPKLPTNWTEKSLKEYFNGPQIDSLEGIYEKMKLDIEDTESQYRIAVVKTDNLSYNVIYLSGAKYPDDWQEGEIKAVLNKSAVPNYYKVDWYMRAKALNKDVYLQRTPEGILEFMFPDKNPSSKWSYLKTYPVKW